MLDNSKDGPKLDAMRRIVSMMAQGKDASNLFPAVVKNVVSKNIEVKKLVYVYLVRYAEEQQDLALLSISTFQRALKDSNQLIRASALRVLSSIRVPVICPIMMICLKEASMDMSPYVRKTAANAIPKLYSLDPEQKDALVEIIEKLLQDKTTLVAGSVIYAFEDVCPERIDLIHKNFRKLCNMLIDIDEWGQVAVINMLTRYARTQFLDPNKNEEIGKEEKFYPSSDDSSDDNASEDNEKEEEKKVKNYVMDSDHRLLLRSAKPLLQSRNAAVVMAVAKLFFYCAPVDEVVVVVRALIRLLRSHREVQTVVLSNIVTMSIMRKAIFQQYLKSFFVHSDDSTNVRLLKLEILTNLATASNISVILREFQTYVKSSDKEFAASTVQAIGRCASNITDVTDSCLAGLVRLLSNRNESVVGESVVVIKKLLQHGAKEHTDIIVHMAKIIDKITVSMARASILWLIGEYSDHIPKIAPDVLRKMAKTFTTEEDIVKLQIITLGAKLYLTNSKQTKLLCQYVLQLAKYDQNYDVRDRARFVKALLFPSDSEESGGLKKKAKKFFLSEKPAPIIESVFKDRSEYQLGSLSHMINSKAVGYQDLPAYPEVQPDPTVRNVEVVDKVWGNQMLVANTGNKKSSFYSDTEDDEDESDEGSEESDSEEEESDEEESSGDDEDETDEDEEVDDDVNGEDASMSEKDSDKNITDTGESDESQSDESDESSESEYESESEEEKKGGAKVGKQATGSKTENLARNKQSYDQLLDFDDDEGTHELQNSDVLVPSISSDIQSLSLSTKGDGFVSSIVTSDVCKSYELLNRLTGEGLSIEYKFTRAPCIFSSTMVGVELIFRNSSSSAINKISVGTKRLTGDLKMEEFKEIDVLHPSQSTSVAIGIDFRDTTQPANFDICTQSRKFAVSIKPPVGELMHKNPISQDEFIAEKGKLTGMTENCITVAIPDRLKEPKLLIQKIIENVNVAVIPSTDEDLFRFAGKLVSSSALVLISVFVSKENSNARIVANCERISIISLLTKEISHFLS